MNKRGPPSEPVKASVQVANLSRPGGSYLAEKSRQLLSTGPAEYKSTSVYSANQGRWCSVTCDWCPPYKETPLIRPRRITYGPFTTKTR